MSSPDPSHFRQHALELVLAGTALLAHDLDRAVREVAVLADFMINGTVPSENAPEPAA